MRHGRIVLLGLALALPGGCGDGSSADNQTNVGSVLPAAGSAGLADAGASAASSASPAAPGSSQCPAPASPSTSSIPIRWARNPTTAECCAYASASEAPPSWPIFPTEAECQTDCRCATVEDLIEGVGLYNTERTSLECRCASGECPATVGEATRAQCATGRRVRRIEGCGLVRVVMSDGFTSQAWVFESGAPGSDAGSPGGSLVGAASSTDAQSNPCQTYVWIAGRELDCDDTVECMLCDVDPESGFATGTRTTPPLCD